MMILTIEHNGKYYALHGNNVVELGLHAHGVRDVIEQRLDFSNVVQLLKNNKHKNLDSFYNPYTNGVIELDLAIYPPDRYQYQYCYTFVDTKTRQIFTMATRDKSMSTTLKVLKAAWDFYNKDIKMICVDRGSEFVNREMEQFCSMNNITLNIGMTNRRFNGIVEAYIGFIKKYVNEKLGENQLRNISQWNQWREYVQKTVDTINQHNALEYPKKYSMTYSKVKEYDTDIKVGDLVHVKLDYPASVLTGKRVHGEFRYGDMHWTSQTYPITKIILRNNDQAPRYKVSGLKNAEKTSFKRAEILPKVN